MRFTAPRADLANMAGWAARAISGVKSMPILSGMIVRADDYLQLAAFNYDDLHEGRVAAQITELGEVLVPGLPFAQLLANLRGPEVEVSTEEHELVLKSRTSEIHLHTMALEQYPNLPPVAYEPSTEMDAESLADVLGALAPLAERESLNTPWQSCAFVRGIEDKGLQIYCGTRIIMGRTFQPADVVSGFEIMVPARKLVETIKPFEGTLRLGVDDGRLGLAANDQRASVRTFADDHYPVGAAEQLFKQAVADTFKIPTSDFREAVKLMAPAGDLVSLEFQPDQVLLTSGNNDALNERAVVTDAVECEGSGGGWRKISLKYLLATVAAIGDETLEIGLIPQRNLMSISGSSVEYVMATITQEARAIHA